MAHVSVPMYWRTIPQRYRLVGQKCKKCGAVNFPPKGVCKYCSASSEFDEVQLSGKGKVHTFVLISAGGAPPEFAEQEKGHKKVFEKLIEEGCRTGAPKGKQSTDMRLSDYLVDVPFDPEMSYQDSLILAMKREEKSAAFYQDLARKVSDPCLAETIQKLAGEEVRHKAKLEEIYEKEVLTED